MYKFTLLCLVLTFFGTTASAQTFNQVELEATLTCIKTETSPLEIPLTRVEHFITLAVRSHGTATAGILEVRSSADNRTWSTWQTLADDPHVDLPAGQRQFNMLFLPVDSRYVQVRAIGLCADLGVSLFFYSPVDLPSENPVALDQPLGFRNCPCALPAYVNRAGWGGPPNQQPGCTPSYTTVTHLFVHHQAGVANPPYAAVVASIWNLHVNTNGWCDVGYQWLIAPDGTVYQGRSGGNNVVGAHATGLNGNTMAVCMLGNFQNDQPTQAALESLNALLAWKCCDSDIDPTGTSVHAGSGQTFKHISGHRDGAATLCPGDNMYARLPNVRTGTDSLYTDPSGCDGIWPPANDNCAGAVALTSLESCLPESSTINEALASGVAIPVCSGFSSGTALDVWFRFNAAATHHQVTVTPTGVLPDALDAVVAVYDGACGALELVACVDAPGGAGAPTTLDLPGLTPGHDYSIRVFDYGNAQAADGRFDICVTHGAAVSTSEEFDLAGMRVFPNPSNGRVRVELRVSDPGDGNIRVFSATGQLVLERNTNAGAFDLDLTGRPAGLYVLEFQTGSGVLRQMLVLN